MLVLRDSILHADKETLIEILIGDCGEPDANRQEFIGLTRSGLVDYLIAEHCPTYMYLHSGWLDEDFAYLHGHPDEEVLN